MSVQIVKHKPYLIGLTGGIASGKTTAANLFKEKGIPVIDSDLIVKTLWQNDLDMVKEIEITFGYPMTNEGKKKLAQTIFQDDEKRKMLNRIIHPKVFSIIEDEKKKMSDQEIIVIDMPLLIEVGYQREVDTVVLVYVDLKTQIDRLMNRDHLSEEDAYLRINSQMSLEEKKGYADLVLDNTKDIRHLSNEIHNFLCRIKHEKQ